MTSSRINKEWRLIASGRVDSQEGWVTILEARTGVQGLDSRDSPHQADADDWQDVRQDRPWIWREGRLAARSWVIMTPGTTSSYPISLTSWSAPCANQRRKRVFFELGPVFQRRTTGLDLVVVELDPASAVPCVFGEWWWKSERQSPEFTRWYRSAGIHNKIPFPKTPQRKKNNVAQDSYGSNRMFRCFCPNLFSMAQAFRKWNNIGGHHTRFFRKGVWILLFLTLLSMEWLGKRWLVCLKVARNEVKNASFAQRSAHRDSRIWRPELIEPAEERKRRARRRRRTFKSAYSDP